MSQQLVPQLDVGAITLGGLSQFSTALAAISADNVTPTALIQLAALGSHFLTSGNFAEKIPDLLQRTSSTRLDRLGVVIGWKRGDAASFMAQIAGGQSIALLCLCLQGMCGDTAWCALYDVSERILPRSHCISSVGQLSLASMLLSAKLAPIGYGNIIAKESLRVCSIYERLSKGIPKDLYDMITRESLCELLTAISRVYSEDDCQVRIKGTQGMAFILTTLIVAFPHDLSVVIEGCLVHKGLRQLIVLYVTSGCEAHQPVSIDIEHKIRRTSENSLSLAFEYHAQWGERQNFSYRWQGHLRQFLEVIFISVGLRCPEELVVAICDEMIHTFTHYDRFLKSAGFRPVNTDSRSVMHVQFPRDEITALLGPDFPAHIVRTCIEILEVEPSGVYAEESSTFSRLLYCFIGIPEVSSPVAQNKQTATYLATTCLKAGMIDQRRRISVLAKAEPTVANGIGYGE